MKAPPLLPRPDLRLLLEDASLRLSTAFAGHSGDEEADMLLIREDFVRRAITEKLSECSSPRKLR